MSDLDDDVARAVHDATMDAERATTIASAEAAETQALRAAKAALAAAPGRWLPIESAPRDGTEVLLALWDGNNPRNGRVLSVGHWHEGMWHNDCPRDKTTELYPPTHWQPLPAPPEEHGDV